MKKLIVLSFLLMTTIFVNAQRRGGPPSPEMRAKKMVAELTTELNLSTAQQTQLKEIFAEQQQNRKAGGKNMRDLSQEEKEAFRAERKADKAAIDNKIAAILTPAQLETFQKLETEKKANRGQRGGAQGKEGRGKGKAKNKGKGKKGQGKGKGKNKEKATPEMRAEKRTEKLTETLGLDANQQDAVYKLFLQQAPNQKVDRKKLSKEEKELLKAEHQQEKAAFDAELAQILTPAQLEQFQSLPKKEKGKKGKKKGKKNKR